MTIENTASSWRDLRDELTEQQVVMLASDEQRGGVFDAATLLFMARDLASVNLAESAECD